jgi:rSAM/selenodomain-associated transferase 2
MRLSIIIPVLNDAAALAQLLPRLAPLRMRGAEVIVADGGSSDDSVHTAPPWADHVVQAARGRAAQQNAGAAIAQGDVLWFAHADCLPPDNADHLIAQALAQGAAWGRFDVQLTGRSAWLHVVAWGMNQRSRLTGICTGDQGIFVTRAVYKQVGMIPAIALMEDIAFSKALKRVGAPACIAPRLQASGRRWDERGALRTIVTMWWLRGCYFFGADPTKLHQAYYGPASTSPED